MLKGYVKKDIIECDKQFSNVKNCSSFRITRYRLKKHYKDLCASGYYHGLILLRHYIKAASDYYFGVEQKAKNVDLFMFTSSVSSPLGPGSDSEPVSIKLGKLNTFLVDSSQFGFEPILINNIEKAYCYLPSMRGEDCDKRHLTQFYHCEMEMRGGLGELIPIIEGYVKILCETTLLMKNVVGKISVSPVETKRMMNRVIKMKKFPKISFDEAVEILISNGKKSLIHFSNHGRSISSRGEIELMLILKVNTPIWLYNFDRDMVPFYQKPDPKNQDRVINADLLFPPINKKSFGGEILGAGQRQDNAKEMYESLRRQSNVSVKSYKWYIELRNQSNYKATSGFGLGIERFLAWAIGKDNIRDVIPYPRIKNFKTLP